MTPEQFLEWLDKEIEACKFPAENEIDTAKAYWKGMLKEAQLVREKFLTLTPPPATK